MAQGKGDLSDEWKKFASDKGGLPAPKTIDEYKTIKQQRTIDAQAYLKQEAFRILVDNVQVENSEIELPEVPQHKFPVRIYRPVNQTKTELPVLLYFHGGYWSAGDYYSEDLGCRAIIARGCNIVIISFSYRLIGEAAWQDVFADAEHAMKWTWANAANYGADPTKGFIVGGAEAGAHLGAITAIRAKQRYPKISLTGQLLIVPTTIIYPDPSIPSTWESRLASQTQWVDAPVLDESLYMQLTSALDIPDSQKRKGENFPVWADDLKGLPPAYLAMDECDPTRDQGFLYQKLLEDAGVPTRTDYYRGLPNMFVQFPGLPTTAVAGGQLSAGVQWLVDRPAWGFSNASLTS